MKRAWNPSKEERGRETRTERVNEGTDAGKRILLNLNIVK